MYIPAAMFPTPPERASVSAKAPMMKNSFRCRRALYLRITANSNPLATSKMEPSIKYIVENKAMLVPATVRDAFVIFSTTTTCEINFYNKFSREQLCLRYRISNTMSAHFA